MHRCLPSVALALLSSCSGVPSGTAAYVKDVIAYHEGDDGIVVYAILADSAGNMIGAQGRVTLRIQDMGTRAVDADFISRDYDEVLKIISDVTPRDFKRTTVGSGPFAHEAVLLPFGRITFDRFSSRPRGPEVKVLVEFMTSDGRVLTGTDSYLVS